MRRIGARALVGFLLLAALFGNVASGLNRMINLPGDPWLFLAALAGALAGWLLARSRRNGPQAAILASLLGGGFLLLGPGKLGKPLWAWLRAMVDLRAATLQWRPGNPLPDTSLFLLDLQGLGLQFWNLTQKILAWSTSLLRGIPVFDPFATTLVWGLLLWGAAAWAGWAIRRRAQPVAGILPVTALFAASLAFAREEALWLTPILGTALGLIGWNNANRRMETWQARGVDTAEDIPFDLGVWMLAFVLGATALPFLVSYFSPQQAVRLAQHLLQPRSQAVSHLGESLGLSPGKGNESATTGGIMPRMHLLTGGPELSSQVALVVQVKSPDGESGLYWRGATYDVYTGHGWLSSPTQSQEYQARQDIVPEAVEAPAYRWIELDVRLGDTTAGQVFAAGELVRLDQRSRVEWRSAPPEADAFDAYLTGWPRRQVYRAISRQVTTNEAELRAAPQELPAWIAQRYLALPEELPARVRDLALDLSSPQPTSYDKARAIEQYLRSFPYTLQVPEPPPDRDAADFFLFDLRHGYCDYYATSFVVLARAAGLPARLVMGYAPGRYDPASQLNIITEADAHSWAEVYFPTIGWVEFEPTAGRALLEWAPLPPPAEYPPLAPPSLPEASPSWPSWMLYLAGLALLAVLAWLVWQWAQSLVWRRMESRSVLEALYVRLRAQGQRLGLPRARSETPHEFATALDARLEELTKNGRWQSLMAPIAGETQRLTNLYARAIYSPHPTSPHERDKSLHDWPRLRRRLWLARLLTHMQWLHRFVKR